jgi:uncharacterized protein YegP (UPF0339 family)
MAKSILKWEFYQEKSGKWRWRATSTANGEIVGAACQGFATKPTAINNAKMMGYSG